MKATSRIFVELLSASVLVLGAGTTPAEETGTASRMEQKVFAENEKVTVAENTFKPGAESPNVARPLRVVRAIKGGRFQRIYADGRKEDGQYKTDEVKVLDASPPYILKNVGDSDLVLYVVLIKQ
ncbi:hypothetical protein [Paraburkholderia caledonica]|uniref:hypothetical protein n=1 Tax=Paraburkholderia caledonica TaxID=134536 RepID=UPI0038B77E04